MGKASVDDLASTRSYKKINKTMPKLGFQVDHQTGSHIVWKHPDHPGNTVVTVDHCGDMPRGTHHSIVKAVMNILSIIIFVWIAISLSPIGDAIRSSRMIP